MLTPRPIPELVNSFFEKYNPKTTVNNNDILVSSAILGVPLLTRLDGMGPYSPILNATGDKDLMDMVANRYLHTRGLATVAVKGSGVTVVTLRPESNAHTVQPSRNRQTLTHAVPSFGIPIGGISDFGYPIGDSRRKKTQFSRLIAVLDPENPERDFLQGMPVDGEVAVRLGIGKDLYGLSNAARLAIPVLSFGASKGQTAKEEFTEEDQEIAKAHLLDHTRQPISV